MARATPTTRTDPSALPSRIGKLLGEVRWFLLLAVTLAFVCMLASYSKSDPGWSHANRSRTSTTGGRVGARLADVLFFVFGFSAYWWAVLLVRRCWRGWRALSEELPPPLPEARRAWWSAGSASR